MLSVAEATERILRAFSPLPGETVALDAALGRVLCEPVISRVTQPPAAVSAMDGYAVRAGDVAALPARLAVVMSIAAGAAPTRAVGPGEAARIFTGAPLPQGTDTIVIQENCAREGDFVIVREGSANPGQHVRAAGLDFKTGEIGLPAGHRLTARDIALAAAMNWPMLDVHRRPRIAILSTGDELVPPGATPGPAQIVASNGIGLAAFVTACGAEPLHLGIAPDNRADLGRAIDGALGCDLLITSGGASVGEHDLVQEVLAAKGMELDFWKIAMRPGKPLLFGSLGEMRILGLPGNPVSAQVTAALFVRPSIERMSGLPTKGSMTRTVRLGADLKANDQRQDYLRAKLGTGPDGESVATPYSKQDSAMLSLIARADALIVRPPFAPPARAGDKAEIVPLEGGCLSI